MFGIESEPGPRSVPSSGRRQHASLKMLQLCRRRDGFASLSRLFLIANLESFKSGLHVRDQCIRVPQRCYSLYSLALTTIERPTSIALTGVVPRRKGCGYKRSGHLACIARVNRPTTDV